MGCVAHSCLCVYSPQYCRGGEEFRPYESASEAIRNHHNYATLWQLECNSAESSFLRPPFLWNHRHCHKNYLLGAADLSHGISGVAVHVDQHIDKNCLIHVQLYLQQRINNLKAFSSVELEIQQNTNGLLTVSSTFFFFRKLEWPLLCTHCYRFAGYEAVIHI